MELEAGLLKTPIRTIKGVCPVWRRSRGKIPFREIIVGGDDVTFVTDGLLGLALAKKYLDFYRQYDLADEEPALGRAGIAIVNTHYPFAQAYDLAEDLAQSAKTAGEDGRVQSLDWHFAVNGLTESLKDLRERNYSTDSGTLHTRPKQINNNTNQIDSWAQFEEQIKTFQNDEWLSMRNKLKDLLPILRQGATMTAAYRANHPSLPDLPSQQGDSKDGWIGRVCVHYDALEAADFVILPDALGGDA